MTLLAANFGSEGSYVSARVVSMVPPMQTPPKAGDVVRSRFDHEARVVSTETYVRLPSGWQGRVDDYSLEFHEALVAVTPAGPLVWVDLDDIAPVE